MYMTQQANLQEIANAIASLASSIRGNAGNVAGPSRGGGLGQGQIDQIVNAITQAINENLSTDAITEAIETINPAITQDQLLALVEPLEAITGLRTGQGASLVDIYEALDTLRGTSSIQELSSKLTDISNRLSGSVPGMRGIQGIPVQIMNMPAQPFGAGLMGAAGQALADPAMNTVADFFNPFAGKTSRELKDEFKRLGIERYQYLVDTDKGRAAQKLNILREMDEYAFDMINFADEDKPYYVDEGFQRKAFDVFVNTYKSNPKGVPLEQTYRYLPKSIPEAKIKFDGKQYNLIQAGTKMSAKNFRDIERLALKGGDYSDELAVFRDIKHSIDKQEKPMNIIFKARKW
jgi:hypothetical protein